MKRGGRPQDPRSHDRRLDNPLEPVQEEHDGGSRRMTTGVKILRIPPLQKGGIFLGAWIHNP